jgi:hypothetical protein
MTNFILPEDIRSGLLNYLAAKPYREVAEVITLLMGLQIVKEESKETE